MRLPETPMSEERPPLFRLEPSLPFELTQTPVPHSGPVPAVELELPEPPYPRFPRRCGREPDPKFLPKDGNPYRTRVTLPMVSRAMRSWLLPYLRSRLLPGGFHPIVAYLFTEFKFNSSCDCCSPVESAVDGMTEDTAVRAINWLYNTGGRVLALMGGEVLRRPQFVHKIVDYAAQKGFWVHVSTNGDLMRTDLIDRLGDAGMATVNLAVDSVEHGPKALAPIRSDFDYLNKKQYVYGYSVFFNINITSANLDEVRQLTEIAHDSGIATDYQIDQSTMMAHERCGRGDQSGTITPEDWARIDELIDWLIDKSRSGYKMVNSPANLEQMKKFMRGQLQDWNCRAGQNTLIIRPDGSLAPCFPLYSATHDWGVVGATRFERKQLAAMKSSCQPHCSSTLNHRVAYCYDAGRIFRWCAEQAANGFRATPASVGD